jgi:hypothetical protein
VIDDSWSAVPKAPELREGIPPTAPPPILLSSAAPVEPLAVRPSAEFPATAGKPSSIAVIGGRAPIFVVGVEPGITIIRKPASGAAALNLEVSIDGGTRHLLITDMTGSQSS